MTIDSTTTIRSVQITETTMTVVPPPPRDLFDTLSLPGLCRFVGVFVMSSRVSGFPVDDVVFRLFGVVVLKISGLDEVFNLFVVE